MNTPGPTLQRFLDAQAPVIDTVYRELTAGVKRAHWMWFVFPQLAGLGTSTLARQYGIATRVEARAYLQHPVLGPRLRDCMQRVLNIEGRSANEIFGSPDDLKLRSCATLFNAAAPGEALFKALLDRYFNGIRDPQTLSLLR